MSELPWGWAIATLGEIVEVLDSLRIPVNRTERAGRAGTVPYYGATGQVGWIDEAIFGEQLCLLGEDGAPFLEAARPKAYIIDGPAWVNNHAHVLRAHSGLLETRFLKYALDRVDYRPFVTGTTRLKLTKAAMLAIPLPVPPVAEQRRIVAAIEEQLSRLDAASTNAFTAFGRIARLEQAVYGRVMRNEWPRQPLGDLLRGPLRNGLSAKTSPSGTVRILTLTAVTRGAFTEANTKMADLNPEEMSDLWLEAGDVFVQRSNTPELVGTAALFQGEPRWAIFPDLLIRVRTSPALLPEFLALFLKTPTARTYFRRAAQGISGSMPKISQGDIRELRVPVPSVEDQAAAVAEADQALAIVASLRSRVETAIKRGESLRRSILASAFRGELVPQDPNDEPASVLLERIAAERAAAPKPSRRRRVPAGN